MRRAILAAGQRLAAQGVIDEPSHLVEADYRELRALVGSGTGVSGEELAERARYRLEARYTDAPPIIGGEPGEPLPAEWLPPAAARLERALGAVVQEIFVAPQPQTEARKVRGLGVSPGAYEGTARVIRGTSEFGRIEPGDVLVTNSTTTAFNIVLPLLGAIVTDRGGLLSHAAIVAREYGIPGWWAARTPPGCSQTALSCASTGPWARSRSSREVRAPRGERLDAELYGGKAAQLAVAVGAGLPVPPGVALSVELVEAIAAGAPAAIAELERTWPLLRAPLAVRSSAVGEDSEEASFAGQHLTCLNVRSCCGRRPRRWARSGGPPIPSRRSHTGARLA